MCSISAKLRQHINRSIIIYIIGCCCFIAMALASIWFGYYIIRYHDEHEFPTSWTIVSLAGGLLLWEMMKSFRFKTSIPESFKQVTIQDFPLLFELINEVTNTLKLALISKVYTCPDATAAIFIQPQLRNLLFEPRRNLVIGLGFLTQMDDDEIRAMLYHEFGHYVQDEMKSSFSVYTVGQFSKSFTSIKEINSEQGTWQTQMRLQLLMFTYFAIWICNKINKSYRKLAKEMEYDADDVAIKHIRKNELQRALLHAATIRYNYDVVQWGMRQLERQNIAVDNPYMAISFVSVYSRPPQRLLSAEVIKRIERLGELRLDNGTEHKSSIRLSIPKLLLDKVNSGQLCSAEQFAHWLKGGFTIYTEQRLAETSVAIEIHLDRKEHKLPYFDGSYKILIDGKSVGTGNFIKGYTLKRRISPSKHKLTAYAPSGIISSPFEFEVEQDKRVTFCILLS